jgi:hypothetical protein
MKMNPTVQINDSDLELEGRPRRLRKPIVVATGLLLVCGVGVMLARGNTTAPASLTIAAPSPVIGVATAPTPTTSATPASSSAPAPKLPKLAKPTKPEPVIEAAIESPHEEVDEAAENKPTPAERLKLARKLEREAAQNRRLAAAEYRREAARFQRLASTERREALNNTRTARSLRRLAVRSLRRGA